MKFSKMKGTRYFNTYNKHFGLNIIGGKFYLITRFNPVFGMTKIGEREVEEREIEEKC
jgi:hypothetical protein